MKKVFLIVISLISIAFAGAIAPQPVYADCGSKNPAKDEVLKSIGETGSNCSSSGVDNFISGVVTIISYIAGIAAIIAIIISGFKYITSAGDSNKIASAKNTLIYALVGVVVAILAQVLVNFAISTTDGTINSKPCPNGSHRSSDGKKCIPD